ncbi:MFS transporter [Planotetraspora sp. A-T 1434]|uniref:MFS transporter n=1 Tax=Planotetraspora sp. A-T 1434 TaxID=2979219 RepID=UPI0021BE36D9|nr:MFS transporter [Planotetraspora sp. A-T 1434]MCT9933566.1 MFS transporter [Planotetraspora sp. A-T 1434]
MTASPLASTPGRTLFGLVAAETLSGLGTQLSFVALPWFALRATDSPARMAAVFAAELVPVALLGLPSAMLVARVGIRAAMRLADLSRAVLIAMIPLLDALGVLSFPLLLLLVCGVGAFTAPYLACQRSVLPEVFHEEVTVARANSLIEGGTRFAAFAGPAAAGALIAAVGAVNVLWLDAVSYVISFLLLGLLPLLPGGGGRSSADDQGGVSAGLRHLLRDPLLVRLAGATLMYGFLFPVLLATLPVLTRGRFGDDPAVLGWLLAAWGGGSVAGSLLAFRLAGRVPPLRLGGFAACVTALPLWALALPLPAVAVGALLVVSGVCVPVLNTAYITVITLRPPEALRTQVMTALVTGNLLAGAAGYLCAGALLEASGPVPVFLTAAIVASAGALLLTRVAATHGNAAASAKAITLEIPETQS